jgi:D-xylose transport system substrate-binding protein
MRLKLMVPLGQAQERWQYDRQLILSKARALGVEVVLHATSFALASQNREVDHSFLKDVDVLLVISSLSVSPTPFVRAAHQAGVPVVAYDRLITDCPLDLYVSFDNVKVGEMQAGDLVQRKPRGNYVLLCGPPSDYNSFFYRNGQMNILNPFLDRGDIRIAEEQGVKDWLPSEAYRIMRQTLDKAENKVDAVLATNDGLAQGAIQALEERGLAGRVPVTGQDAELSACKRIAAGTQSMTVYKPIKLLAAAAVEAALELVNKQAVDKTILVDNGWGKVPSLLLQPTRVNRDNLEATVVADGFHKKEEIFSPSAG